RRAIRLGDSIDITAEPSHEECKAACSAAISAVAACSAAPRLVVAGPGTGKTTLFRELLQAEPGDRDQKLILTFINNLANEIRRDLGTLAEVFTFHGFCHRLLRRKSKLR